MRPSSTGCVLQVSEVSDEVSGEFSGELFSTIIPKSMYTPLSPPYTITTQRSAPGS
ncbi:hypothetical protein Hanom_Chr03g00241391 [Helianthus anomalus]